MGLTSLVELLCQVGGQGGVTVGLVPAARTHGDEEATKVPRSVSPEVFLQPLAVALLVSILNGPANTPGFT